MLPPPLFYRGAKCAKFWPKFRPQSSSDRRIFEQGRFIGKQKQTCQGPMINLPTHQTWVGFFPQLPEPLAHWVPQRVKVEIFLYILHSSGPRTAGARQYITSSGAPVCTHKIFIDIPPMLPPFLHGGQNVPNFGPNFDPN